MPTSLPLSAAKTKYAFDFVVGHRLWLIPHFEHHEAFAA